MILCIWYIYLRIPVPGTTAQTTPVVPKTVITERMAIYYGKPVKKTENGGQVCLTRETGESGPLFFKSDQPLRERHPTPHATSSRYHFKNCRHTPVFSKSVSDAIYSKNRPHFRMKRRYIAGNISLIFFSESGNTVKKSNYAPEEKNGLDTSHESIASTLRRASPIRFDSGRKTRESV